MRNTKSLHKRATKAGIRAAKRKGAAISKQELLAVKVQVMPASVRCLIVIVGFISIASGFSGWPWEYLILQIAFVLGGGLLTLSGIFGFKKTLSNINDAVDLNGGVDLLDIVVTGVVDSFLSVIDL